MRLANVILAVQAIAWLAFQYHATGFVPIADDDTASYLDEMSLSSYRTLGYPLFLRVVGVDAMPLLTALVFVAAVLVFAGALAQLCGCPVSSAIVASPLFYLVIPDCPVNALLTDHLCFSMEVLTIAFALRTLAPGARPRDWTLLGLCLATSYHIRPAALVMVGLVPILWCLLGWWYQPRSRLARVVGISTLPLILYCSLRWAVIGHFGLVSLGGMSQMVVAGQLLTPEVAATLPESQRVLAEDIIARLSAAPGYRSPVMGRYDVNAGLLCEQPGIIFGVAVDAAKAHGLSTVPDIDAELAALAKAILWRCPVRYLVWCLKASRRVAMDGLSGVFLVPMALCLLAAHAPVVRRRAAFRPDLVRLLGIVFVIAFWFSLLSAALVMVANCPIGRYVAPAFAFWPMVPTAGLLLLLWKEKVQ